MRSRTPDGARRAPAGRGAGLALLAVVATVIGLVVAGPGPAPAGAQPADPRAERAAVVQQRAAALARLDALRASDLELDTALGELDRQVAAVSSRADAARQAAEAAEAEAAAHNGRAEANTRRIAELRRTTSERAVRAYVRPEPDLWAALSASEDWAADARSQALLDRLAGADRDALDELRATQEDYALAKVQAADAAARAAERRADAEAELASLEATRSERAKVQEALDARIADIQAEVDALSAQEAELSAFLASRTPAPSPSPSPDGGTAPSPTPTAAPDSAGAAPAAPSPPGSPAPTAAPTTAPPAPRGGDGFVWPNDGPVSSEFGMRWGRLHAGLDIAGPPGSPVWAAKAGSVIFAGSKDGYGSTVIVDHGEGITTLYAHLSRIDVGEGQGVGAGTQVGAVGSTGRVTGPHLHFEVRVGGDPRNPRNFLP